MLKANIRNVISIVLLSITILHSCSFDENVFNEYRETKYTNHYETFADYLEHNQLYEGMSAGTYENNETELVFSLEYLDQDSIPELVVGWTKMLNNSSDICILKYQDGNVYKIGPIGHYNMIAFVPHDNKILIENAWNGISSRILFEISENGNQKILCESYVKNNDLPELNDFQDEYYVLGRKVNKELYDAYYNGVVEPSTMIGWSGEANRYNLDILNNESIADLREGNIEVSKIEKRIQDKDNTYSNDEVIEYLSSIEGKYEYTDINGISGVLSISYWDYGVHNIQDFYREKDNCYRFSANSYLVDHVSDGRIYIRYPDQEVYNDSALYYDDSFYIIAKNGDGLTVSYSSESFENANILYEAVPVK